MMLTRLVPFIVLATLLIFGAMWAHGDEEATTPADELTGAAEDLLAPRHKRFVEDAALLMTDVEHEIFLGLSEDYQRDHFIRTFWKVRDPYDRTARNELRDQWEERVAVARTRFDDDLTGARARMLLLIGAPAAIDNYSCMEIMRPVEVWFYPGGTEQITGSFTLVFVGQQPRGVGPHRLWQPTEGLQRVALVGTSGSDMQIANAISQQCLRGEILVGALAQAIDFAGTDPMGVFVPEVNDEWVRTFQARSTDVSEDAEPLEAELAVDFPGRHQSRTVVQGVVAVAPGDARPVALGEHETYRFLIDGEILRQGELFDYFRYRFQFPPDQVGESIPLVLQRYLRPGAYSMIVKVEDQGSGRVFRQELALEVPTVERQRREVVATVATPALEGAASSSSGIVDATWLDEANDLIATGDQVIRLLPPPETLVVGKVRFHARARGEGIARVGFELDGRAVMAKSKPPYSVELDLGERPRLHTVRAVAYDDAGNELTADEVLVNAGPHRFSLRLIEPRRGGRYQESIRVNAEVEVPEGERLDRVEVYLNETLLATLYQPPFEQPVRLLDPGELAYVRAVAYLRDGNSAEDVVFVNAPDYIDQVQVQMVQLYTSVTDRGGDFVREGLSKDDFVVREDGVEQEIRRFEMVEDLPIYAGLVLDTSLSMIDKLWEVEKAAYGFLETVLSPKDRAALVTFADTPSLAVRLTNDKAVLAGGLASLTAEGETALWDSIIFSLHYFSGLRGKRAIVVLTDGADSKSRYRYEDAIQFARHTGVAVYVIGLELASQKNEVRLMLQNLASETGGDWYSIDRASQLPRVYEKIEQELRSQYLIVYQSSHEDSDAAFRKVEVEMTNRGMEAKTIRGYVP
ncbi:MAG: VWA domain-containing protein [Acidobacteriota bacterium]